jgi:hypothetical protein
MTIRLYCECRLPVGSLLFFWIQIDRDLFMMLFVWCTVFIFLFLEYWSYL